VVFLEASDDTLVRRFDSVRRPHPLQEGRRVIDGITAERELLRGLRDQADLVLDSSELNVHELRARLRDSFGSTAETALRVNVMSFGYKYGLPLDADLVADCRFLPNPHWVDEFLEAYLQAVGVTLDGYGQAGKHFALIAVGCTGGKHRSVVMAQEIASRLAKSWPGVQVVHRDLGRE